MQLINSLLLMYIVVALDDDVAVGVEALPHDSELEALPHVVVAPVDLQLPPALAHFASRNKKSMSKMSYPT